MTAGDPFRAFWAVPLAAPVAGALERAAARALEAAGASAGGPGSPWRVTPAERIHVTLRFLGDTPASRRGELRRALLEAAAPLAPFPVRFRGWHLLPGPRDPRVLAAGVSDPSGTLPALAAALEEAARALGFPPERRPFLSHATVARRRGGPGRGARRRGGRAVHPPASPEAAPSWGALSAGEADLAGEQVVDRAVLVASTLGPGGPVYEVLEEAPLAGGA